MSHYFMPYVVSRLVGITTPRSFRTWEANWTAPPTHDDGMHLGEVCAHCLPASCPPPSPIPILTSPL